MGLVTPKSSQKVRRRRTAGGSTIRPQGLDGEEEEDEDTFE